MLTWFLRWWIWGFPTTAMVSKSLTFNFGTPVHCGNVFQCNGALDLKTREDGQRSPSLRQASTGIWGVCRSQTLHLSSDNRLILPDKVKPRLQERHPEKMSRQAWAKEYKPLEVQIIELFSCRPPGFVVDSLGRSLQNKTSGDGRPL